MATHQKSIVAQAESITLRIAKPEDAPECGRICYEAFANVNQKHGFPPDFPNSDVATGVLRTMFSHPGFYCIVAESDGKLLGSNCLDERSTIAGVGPITVDPKVQNKSIGRALMRAVLDRSAEMKFPGVRLLQATFHNRSLSLYAKLGFEVREVASVMQGNPINKTPEGYRVRAATTTDVHACNSLCHSVHGHDRGGDLRDAIREGTAVVAERDGRITAYATGLAFFAHAVAEANADLQALIAAASAFLGPGIIVPMRNTGLFRWCLQNGLKVVEPVTLMTIGLYNEPRGAYLPSILY